MAGKAFSPEAHLALIARKKGRVVEEMLASSRDPPLLYLYD